MVFYTPIDNSVPLPTQPLKLWKTRASVFQISFNNMLTFIYFAIEECLKSRKACQNSIKIKLPLNAKPYLFFIVPLVILYLWHYIKIL